MNIMYNLKILLIVFFVGVYASADSDTELLKTFVNISSESNDVAGVNRVQNIFSERLRALGFATENISYPSGQLGHLVVGTFKGTQKGVITFIVHADTVFEKSSGFKELEFSSDGKTAKGPGVIDAKGGMVVLLSGLAKFLDKVKQPKYTLRVISSPGEEVGTPEFLRFFKQYSDDSILVLGFEPCLDDGSIIDSRRGNRWYNIKVTGREAHAGRAHKDGINACWELSKKLNAISNLTDYSKDLTVSIGRIEGGKDKYNIVCGEASAKIDVRFSTLENRDLIHKKIEKIVADNTVKSSADGMKAKSAYEIVDDTSPFSTSKMSVAKIALIKRLINQYEHRDVRSAKSGGAADANNFSRPGLSIVDGMGACGGEMHTANEFVVLSSLKTRADVLSEFLEKQ